MPKKYISKQKVIDAAQGLVEKGRTPTLAAVRARLGNQGSLSTIHKYLKDWKENCFKQTYNQKSANLDISALVEDKRILEQALKQQKGQIEQYSEALIKSERELLQLKAENQGLKEENLQLQNELKETLSLKNHFEILYQEIKAERNTLYEKEMAEKNRLIEALQEELKVINHQAIIELRNAGYERDDAVMQERVKIINLQEKIIKLGDENKTLLQELRQEKQFKTNQKSDENQGTSELTQEPKLI